MTYQKVLLKKLKIGVLVSGGGTNLQAILDACDNQVIDGKVVVVGSDIPDAYGLDRAKKFAVPTFCIDYKTISRQYNQTNGKIPPPRDFDLNDIYVKQTIFSKEEDPEYVKNYLKIRAIAEEKLYTELMEHNCELLVLAGFMRLLSPYFIDKFNAGAETPRIMNIHPALLPAFPGTDGYGDTFRYGCKIGGCTVHFVDYGEDTGPIIGQKAFQIMENDTLKSVMKRGLTLEWKLYPECIQLFAQKRLKLVNTSYRMSNGKTVNRKIVQRWDLDDIRETV